ncbi:MAG: hypothetical protein ACFCUG_10390 [Thiotrichales bacterium]
MPKTLRPTPELTGPTPLVALPRPLRVMLELDPSAADWDTLEFAVQVAALLRGELHGRLVQNLDLLRVAGLPFASEIGVSSAFERGFGAALMQRSLRAAVRAIEMHLARIADAAKVHWSLRVIHSDLAPFGAAEELFDITIRGPSRTWRHRASVKPADRRQRLLWWLDPHTPPGLAQELLGGLAHRAELEVFLLGADDAGLSAWLHSVRVPTHRLGRGDDPRQLRGDLTAWRIQPSYCIAPRSLGSEMLDAIAREMGCPVLVFGD